EFATPLVELPVEKVTPQEQRAYEVFRLRYLRLWRRYFDPVGIRFRLGPGPVRVEVYLLPLVQNSEYQWLRDLTGGGVVRYDPSRIPAGTAMQLLFRLSPQSGDLLRYLPGIGDWFSFHLDSRDLPVGKLAGDLIEGDLQGWGPPSLL